MKRSIVFGAVASLVLSAGIAYAAATSWGEYRVDLIRCADAAGVCGSVVTGTDPLSSGKITLDTSSVAVRLRGAKPDTAYRVTFIQLKNTGTNVSGPYGVGAGVPVGDVTTDKHGNTSVTFKKSASVDPRLGFFYIGHPGVSNEFVTGIDQN